MLRLKQCMGFLLVGTLLWLMWILGQMRGVDAVVELGAILLVIAILAWIKGAFWTPFSSARSRILAFAAMVFVSPPGRRCLWICHQAEPTGLAAVQQIRTGRGADLRQTGVRRFYGRLVYHV